MEIPNAVGANGWTVAAGNRPGVKYSPSTGNSFHHNTVIWDEGSSGWLGFWQGDPQNQPLFFIDNPAPDFNSYHLPSTSAKNFIYDNNTSGRNTRLTFTQYQANGADVHSTIDTKYNVGYPTVKITSPADGTTVTNSVVVAAAASDGHGISKVEFFVDWKLESTITSPPYNFNWSGATVGKHTVAAMAYSDAGVNACYAVTLNKK
jgi:hypothetical protein